MMSVKTVCTRLPNKKYTQGAHNKNTPAACKLVLPIKYSGFACAPIPANSAGDEAMSEDGSAAPESKNSTPHATR